MTHTELIHRIQDIIRNITHREPTVPIHVHNIEPKGYEVCIEFNQYSPTCYSAELSDDDFIKFICKELKQCQYLKTRYFKAERNTHHRRINNFLSPYDTTRINGENR